MTACDVPSKLCAALSRSLAWIAYLSEALSVSLSFACSFADWLSDHFLSLSRSVSLSFSLSLSLSRTRTLSLSLSLSVSVSVSVSLSLSLTLSRACALLFSTSCFFSHSFSPPRTHVYTQ